MGKSHKKVKNDRINALRKQYDAFLEEDKKRRDRNEYILGQLDKMRSSGALVPVSVKANYNNMDISPSELYMRQYNPIMKIEMRDTHLERQKVTSSVLNTPLEELRILKEISKKFILIPKRTRPIENDVIYSKNINNADDNDADWKSKYNILDDLKKLEKEEPSDSLFNQYKDDSGGIVNKRNESSMHLNDSNKVPGSPITQKRDELSFIEKITNEIAVEQDKVNKQVNFNIPEKENKISEERNIPLQTASVSPEQVIKNESQQPSFNAKQEYLEDSQQDDVAVKEKYNTESNEKELNMMNNTSDNTHAYEIYNNNHQTVYQENTDASENSNLASVEPNTYMAPKNIKTDTMLAASDQSNSEVKSQQLYTVEKSVHLNQNNANQNDTRAIHDFTPERVDLYENVDKNPEGQIVNETTSEEPHDYDPTQNTAVDLENIPNPNYAEHESEINAFEAEQREMFYSEQNDPDAYGYNQGEGNTGEYAEGYENNEQYAYYEGVQQEQAYATNINEHEESTERYDPHYSEQYEGSYENQQPDNAYEQQQYEVENVENVASHLYQQVNVGENEGQDNVLPQDDRKYDQHLYAENSGTQEHIEQQLTVEEGYIESPPVATDGYQEETQREMENVLEATNVAEPVLDEK